MSIRELHTYEFCCDGYRADDNSLCLNTYRIEARDEGVAGGIAKKLGWTNPRGNSWFCAAPAGHMPLANIGKDHK